LETAVAYRDQLVPLAGQLRFGVTGRLRERRAADEGQGSIRWRKSATSPPPHSPRAPSSRETRSWPRPSANHKASKPRARPRVGDTRSLPVTPNTLKPASESASNSEWLAALIGRLWRRAPW